MPFFEPPEPPDFSDDDEDEDWLQQVPTQLGNVVALNLIVGRGPDAVVALTHLQALQEGFEMIVKSILRGDAAKSASRNGPVGPFYMPDPRTNELPDEFLRVGLEFANGQVVTNMTPPWLAQQDTGEYSLEARGGGGSNIETTASFWVRPLPGPGVLKFVCEWPAFGVRETAMDLDGDWITTAGRNTSALWQ